MLGSETQHEHWNNTGSLSRVYCDRTNPVGRRDPFTKHTLSTKLKNSAIFYIIGWFKSVKTHISMIYPLTADAAYIRVLIFY